MFELKAIPGHLKPVLENLFSGHHRVDLAIQSILEGQTGANISIVIDDMDRPVTAQLQHGSFTVFAGAVDDGFIQSLKKPCAVQPSPQDWMVRVRAAYPSVKAVTRYSFHHHSLDKEHLQSLIDAHPMKDQMKRLDASMANDLAKDEWGQYHFMNYNSPEHFIQTGVGFGVIAAGRVVAACTSALVCSTGIEFNIITGPLYRRQGFATLTAARLIIHCLEKGLQPHWDAANATSKDLALKLGYTFTNSYELLVIPS